MKQTKWHQPTIRHQLWLDCIAPFLNEYHIKPSDKILHFYGTSNFKTEHLLERFVPQDAVKTIDIFTRKIAKLQQDPVLLKDSFYNLSFFSFDPNIIKLERMPDFIEKNYNALKPTGRLLFVFPGNNSTTSITFRKFMETGMYPELDRDTLKHHDKLLEAFHYNLKQSNFINANFEIFNQKIELSDTFQFRQYLSQVAHLYTKVIPEDISHKVIDFQTACFEEICQEKYDGKLFFDYEIHAITAIK